MIARIWRGVIRATDLDPYVTYIQNTGIKEYKQTPGNQGAWMLTRLDGDKAEIITLSFWDSYASIEGFAGPDLEKAVYYPEDDHYLLDRPEKVLHYEIT
ncbi:hypothetical protein VMT65_21910 [Nocardia sp. CDC153]|uniref:hypothetical protein n=1 Tax=Nocardia sp. CDC153 TaxID=3112167 RepID=UPI002DB64587|nr:hypothetical protein [Nocardia sp. CDC153]MEC3955708.1 hypothetical protein [Nocardia sp. CDC153]